MEIKFGSFRFYFLFFSVFVFLLTFFSTCSFEIELASFIILILTFLLTFFYDKLPLLLDRANLKNYKLFWRDYESTIFLASSFFIFLQLLLLLFCMFPVLIRIFVGIFFLGLSLFLFFYSYKIEGMPRNKLILFYISFISSDEHFKRVREDLANMIRGFSFVSGISTLLAFFGSTYLFLKLYITLLFIFIFLFLFNLLCYKWEIR